MHDIMTCCDSGYFSFAWQLALNIQQYSQCRLHVYDLGLTEKERTAFTTLGVILHKVPIPENSFTYNSRNNIRTTHKINCIEDCLKHVEDFVIVLDADILVIEPIFAALKPVRGGLTVTARCEREKQPHILVNGKLNAGVLAFDKTVSANLFASWRLLCEDPEHTDQSALSTLLDGKIHWEHFETPQVLPEGYSVRVLDGNLYNDTTCRKGLILHFKNAGRHKAKWRSFLILAWCQRTMPTLTARCIALNRKYHWI